jgi:hypothetical protein
LHFGDAMWEENSFEISLLRSSAAIVGVALATQHQRKHDFSGFLFDFGRKSLFKCHFQTGLSH